MRAAGAPLVRLDRGGDAGARGRSPPRRARRSPPPTPSSSPTTAAAWRPASRRARGARRRVPLVWDPHPRGPEPVPGAPLVTPNAAEAAQFGPPWRGRGDADGRAAGCCSRALGGRRRRASRAAPRRAARRAAIGPPLAIPAPPATGDPCGAGDCFAATAALAARPGRAALRRRGRRRARPPRPSWRPAGRAPSVRARRAAEPPDPADPFAVAERVRAHGGTVVATGGCFDLLHAGHVRMLEAARALGDCLVVCLNSDASVAPPEGRRPAAGPARTTAPRSCARCAASTASLVFEEDEPSRRSSALRPDVWVKGGDYAVARPARGGGARRLGRPTVLVPYVAGRSTTRLIEEAVARAQ